MPIRLSIYKYKKLQQSVVLRDNFHCQDCGVYTENQPHHIIFKSRGGDDTAENLILLCQKCHAQKHGITIK